MPTKKNRASAGAPKAESSKSAKGTPSAVTKKDGSKNTAGSSGGKDGYQ